MDVDKTSFDKLKQLDRIEFRQKYNSIKEYYTYNLNLFPYLIAMVFLFVTDIWCFIKLGHTVISSSFIIVIYQVALVLMLLEVFLCGVYFLFRIKHIRKLEQEYFDIKPKGDKS